MYGGADDNVAEPVVDKSGDDVILLTFLTLVIISILLFLWLCIFVLIGLIFLELLGLIDVGCQSLTNESLQRKAIL